MSESQLASYVGATEEPAARCAQVTRADEIRIIVTAEFGEELFRFRFNH
jgi:hypothetical protein